MLKGDWRAVNRNSSLGAKYVLAGRVNAKKNKLKQVEALQGGKGQIQWD
jgi:TolB-like protein